MMNEAFPTFEDIEHKPLRIWNRCVLFFNLKEDSGDRVADQYLRSLPKHEIKDMYIMYQDVLVRGRKAVLKDVTKDMPLQEDEQYAH